MNKYIFVGEGSRFYVFKDDLSKYIIKLPKFGSYVSYMLLKKLKCPGGYKSYCNTLLSLKDSFLNKLTCNIIKINKDGGYICEYIEGFNLGHINSYSKKLDKKLKNKIIHSIDNFLNLLENHQKDYRGILGDWSFTNLIYSTKYKKIVNIDLEGFYYFRYPCNLNNFKLINSRANLVKYYLKD